MMEKCQWCNKKAVYNRANGDLIYKIYNNNGDMELIGTYIGDQSQYFCEEHIGKYNEIDKNEDIAMLERENKAMAEKFAILGYTQEQISDICNGAI